MNRYEVWIEGHQATGDSSEASFEGVWEANTFKEACIRMLKEEGWDIQHYNEERNAYWGCGFYDNETDARKTFG